MNLDKYDKMILSILQEDADSSLNDIAEKVSLTKNPCWRRIQKLQELGYIRKKVALLNAQKINLGVTVFVNITTNQHTVEWFDTFSQAVNDIPEIIEFYRMSGNVDYILKIVVPSIQEYDSVYKKLIKKVDIYNVDSYFAMEELKNNSALPLAYC